MKTLEELMQLLADAQAALEAKPDDEALKTAVAEAQAAVDAKKAEQDSGGGGGKIDETKLDDETKNYIAKLRKENGSHRTKAKDLASQVKAEKERVQAILKAAGIAPEGDKPEEKVKSLSSENQTLAFHNAVLETAVEHGIPKDSLKFFKFLVSEATNELDEGEELSDDKLAEIVAEAKKGRAAKPANSTVDGKGAPAPGASEPGKITLEKFCSMSISEKSALYLKNQDLYAALMSEAKAKKKLV